MQEETDLLQEEEEGEGEGYEDQAEASLCVKSS